MTIEIIAISGVPEVVPGNDLGALLLDAAPGALRARDVLVVTQKIVSKAEGRIVPAADKESALQSESARILRRQGSMIISETSHGLVCANAGIDASNVVGDNISLLPVDPDASARRLRSRIQHLAGIDVAVIVSDTFGRAWRLGQTDVAIGVAGIEPFVDYRGRSDAEGRPLSATRIAIADELAGAAEMVMGKVDGICAAIVRGAPVRWGRGAATDIVRSPGDDLFR